MDYTEYIFELKPYDESYGDVLAFELGEVGFDSFDTDGEVLKGYIQSALINRELIDSVIKNFPISCVDITYTSQAIPSSDWNSVWESSFTPIRIGNLSYIHDQHHPCSDEVEYDIIIHPRMAFGSGSHSTTRLMLQLLLSANNGKENSRLHSPCLTGQSVLDVGCGTGILGIAATKSGCSTLTALDIDIDSVENTRENLRLNGIDGAEVIEGELSIIDKRKQFDIILANIHLNIHLSQMELYSAHLLPSGRLLLSGFYTDETNQLIACASDYGMTQTRLLTGDGWCAMEFIKEKLA